MKEGACPGSTRRLKRMIRSPIGQEQSRRVTDRRELTSRLSRCAACQVEEEEDDEDAGGGAAMDGGGDCSRVEQRSSPRVCVCVREAKGGGGVDIGGGGG